MFLSGERVNVGLFIPVLLLKCIAALTRLGGFFLLLFWDFFPLGFSCFINLVLVFGCGITEDQSAKLAEHF